MASIEETRSATIESLEAEIELHEHAIAELKAVKAALIDGIGVAAHPSEKPARKLSGAAKAAAERKAAKENDDEKPKSSRRARSRKAASSSNGDGDGESRKDQILSMLKDGKKAAEIAEELGTHVGYVYTVKRKAEQS